MGDKSSSSSSDKKSKGKKPWDSKPAEGDTSSEGGLLVRRDQSQTDIATTSISRSRTVLQESKPKADGDSNSHSDAISLRKCRSSSTTSTLTEQVVKVRKFKKRLSRARSGKKKILEVKQRRKPESSDSAPPATTSTDELEDGASQVETLPDEDIHDPNAERNSKPGSWKKVTNALGAHLTRHFEKLSSRYKLEFPPPETHTRKPRVSSRPPETKNGKKKLQTTGIHPVPPKSARTSAKIKRAVEARTTTTTSTSRKFSILDLGKSREKRKSKAINMQLGFSLVFRKGSIRRNNNSSGTKGRKPDDVESTSEVREIGSTDLNGMSDSIPFSSVPFESTRSVGLNRMLQAPTHSWLNRYDGFLTRTSRAFIPKINGDYEYGNNLRPQMESQLRSEQTFGKSSMLAPIPRKIPTMDAEEDISLRNYYPRTPFTAQFAHLLSIGRF